MSAFLLSLILVPVVGLTLAAGSIPIARHVARTRAIERTQMRDANIRRLEIELGIGPEAAEIAQREIERELARARPDHLPRGIIAAMGQSYATVISAATGPVHEGGKDSEPSRKRGYLRIKKG